MNLLYHITNLPPRIPNTEASLQELDALRRHFGGKLIHLNPNQHSPIYVPRLLFGVHQLKRIRAEENQVQAHHLYNADPFPFLIARWLRKPVIYTVSSGVSEKRPNVSYFNKLAAVTVSDERSYHRLRDWGVDNCFLVRPGIDTGRFTHSPLPLRSKIRLMVGSAPWTLGQFKNKGVDALLAAVQQTPQVHLICLWRGVLADEMRKRVQQMGLEQQVEIINRRVDVNEVLARVHASIALANDPAVIRAYPHSLIESIAAGKPVLISRGIPMADYVAEKGVGVIVERVTAEDIESAIETLARSYASLQQSIVSLGQGDFSKEAMIESFEAVYRKAVEKRQ